MSNVLCLKRLFLPSHHSFCSPALYQLCLSPRLRQCILSTCITSVSSNLRICDLYNSPDSYFQLSLGYNHFDSQTWHLYNCSQKHSISPNIQKSIFLTPGTSTFLPIQFHVFSLIPSKSLSSRHYRFRTFGDA